ncbi:MAG: serine/threonine-protein kinase [Myxococcaceae bacterium]
MGDTGRRLSAIAVTVVVAGAALLADSSARASHRAGGLALAREQARTGALEAAKAVEAMAAELLQGAISAAANQGLRDLVQHGVDGPAYEDFLRNERAWSTFRDTGPTLLFVGDLLVATSGEAPPLTAVHPLAGRALAAGKASGALEAGGRPLLVAAARVPDQTPTTLGAVVVLARPLDVVALASVTRQIHAGVALLARGKLVVAVGEPPERALLQRYLASPADSECCAGVELASGLTIVAARDPEPRLLAASREAGKNRAPLFGGAAVVVLAALAFGFWPRDKLLQETTAELKRSREELARISGRVMATGEPPPAAAPPPEDPGLSATATSVSSSRYEVVDLLGEGGMARVHVAQVRGAEGFRRLFVVKRLRQTLSGNEEAVNQFIDEARLGASLVHSNIVPVFDFGRDADGYYIAQEYILGRSVDALVQASVAQRGRPLEGPVVLYLMSEALKALGYAHTKADDAGKPLALVHRDVSPNNLMVSARGEVKLLDFGIVKSDARLTKTQAGMVKGNLFYMSPEQARTIPVDCRSDLFSLGLVAFNAATAQTLYDGNTSFELLNRAAAGPTASDLGRIAALPSPLPQLLGRALSMDPAARFASAEEFGKAVASGGPMASAAELHALMSALFHAELEAEQARFAKT